MNAYYSAFETPIGCCGVAWRDASEGSVPAVLWFQLPEATAALTEARIAEKSGAGKAAAAPLQIAALIEKVGKHLAGELQDFRGIQVDLSAAAPFARRVLETTREIPAGRTVTYGELARSVGRPDAARAVGQIMAGNPIPLIIPCHRVVAAGGRPGGFSAPGGRATKADLLAIERAGSGLLFSHRSR
jgi:O-6-methylguanine DNA methyltransferase